MDSNIIKELKVVHVELLKLTKKERNILRKIQHFEDAIAALEVLSPGKHYTITFNKAHLLASLDVKKLKMLLKYVSGFSRDERKLKNEEISSEIKKLEETGESQNTEQKTNR